MPRLITQYRVFIGSPGGLGDERRCFRDTLERYCRNHSEPRGVLFHPGAYENLFVSTAHTRADVAATLDAARQVAADLALAV